MFIEIENYIKFFEKLLQRSEKHSLYFYVHEILFYRSSKNINIFKQINLKK